MKRAALVMVVVLAGCENKYEKMAQQAPSASIAIPVASVASAAPIAAALPPPKKKREFKCDDKASTVDFHGDAALEAEVRLKLSKKPSDPISKSELANVKSLNLTKNGHHVDDLDPCVMPLFTGLKDLFLGEGELDDLTPIQTLTTLESLRASGTHIKDLRPISHLGKLDRLDLSKTPIVDIEPLKTLTALTELQLDDTSVEDITPLANMKKLQKLHLRNTPVKNLAPLKDLRDLRLLEVQGTPVVDTSMLQPLVAHGLQIKMGLGDKP
jgi:internalin A